MLCAQISLFIFVFIFHGRPTSIRDYYNLGSVKRSEVLLLFFIFILFYTVIDSCGSRELNNLGTLVPT